MNARSAATVDGYGKVYGFKGAGWESAASAGDRPVIIRKAFGKGAVYVYLGDLVYEGAAALRPLLTKLAEQSAPLRFAPADDQVEYVAYRKGAGAWVAMFNHGAIPIGSDRLKEPRMAPPEPLCSKVKGPYQGQVELRLDKLGLDPAGAFVLYEVQGINGAAFEGVISGNKTFTVSEIASKQDGGVVTGAVKFNKRGQYVVAPKGQGETVFFGK